MATSRADIDHLLQIVRAKNIIDGLEQQDNSGLFPGLSAELERTLDDIPFGSLPWSSFQVRWSGPLTPTSPSWKRQTYIVHRRDPLATFENTLRNTEYKRTFDPAAYREYTHDGKRIFSNFMSGLFAWKESVRAIFSPLVHVSCS